MNDPTSPIALNTRLDELERRVAVLERGQSAQSAAPALEQVHAAPLLSAAPVPAGSGFFSVIGKAMLGIAGAYLLRAVAESGAVPGAVLAPFAIVYALGWLVVGMRGQRALSQATYVCTSLLILGPMLWELTMRFHVLAAWSDALALAAMAGIAFVLGRAKGGPAVLRIAFVAVAGLSLALAIATHSNLPFLAVLLLLMVQSELAALDEKFALTRALVALAADLGVWMLIYIYRSAHADYPEIGTAGLMTPGFALFAIAAASTAVSAGVRRRRISAFETVQTVIAFFLACCGLLYFGPVARLAMLGAICLLLAAAVYAALLTMTSADADGRNRTVFATWSAGLLLAGSFLCVPAQWRTEWLGLSAIAASGAAVRGHLLFLAVHGNVFLLASMVASGLGVYAWAALAGTPAGAPSFGVLFVLLCAVACYLIVRRSGDGIGQSISYAHVAVAAIMLAALIAHGAIALAALRFEPGAQHVALMRSLAFCVLALALAFGGAALRRRELTHVGYAVVVVEALKLVAEDLRHGHLAYIAASVCLFAMTLIALPRVARRTGAAN